MLCSIFLLATIVVFNQNVWSQNVLSSINANCTINHDGRVLKEGESIEMRGKLYKMEDCGLHRAYHACGIYLLQMVSIACEVVRQQKLAMPSKMRPGRFSRRKLLTEACCETLCTVSEMTRYCP